MSVFEDMWKIKKDESTYIMGYEEACEQAQHKIKIFEEDFGKKPQVVILPESAYIDMREKFPESEVMENSTIFGIDCVISPMATRVKVY